MMQPLTVFLDENRALVRAVLVRTGRL